MKYLFIILLLFTLKINSQVDLLTKSEKELLLKIATPSKLQEWADNKKKVKDLLIVIKQKEKTIDSLDNQIEKQNKDFTKFLKELALKDKKITKTSKKIDEINKSIISKLKWNKLHLFFKIEVPNLTYFKETTYSSELTYKLNLVEFGVNGGFKRIEIDINQQPTYQFNSKLMIKFMIF